MIFGEWLMPWFALGLALIQIVRDIFRLEPFYLLPSLLVALTAFVVLLHRAILI